jgi:hypothetical protein
MLPLAAFSLSCLALMGGKRELASLKQPLADISH